MVKPTPLGFLLFGLFSFALGAPPPLTTGLPNNGVYKGCLPEPGNGARVFPYMTSNPGTNTPITCISHCASLGYSAGGVEWGQECWCGATTDVKSSYVADSQCDMACDGDPAHSCGGFSILNVYFFTSSTPPPLTTGLPNNGVYKGCLPEPGNGARVFPYMISNPGTNTPLTCINHCASLGYSAGGVEWGQECWCGSTTDVKSSYVADSQCNMACDGDPAHSCGGNSILNVYFFTSSTPPPLTTGLPSNWQYEGCLPEPGNGGRVFAYHISAPGTNTPITCINHCASLGYSAAGVQWGQECWCGSTTDVKSSYVADSQCNMACDGDPAHSCGGNSIQNVYFLSTSTANPPPLTTGLPGNWVYKGCLPEREPSINARVFPYKISNPGTNTPIACMNQCAAFGFSAAGLEWGQECWCGDTTDVMSGFVPDSQCNMACDGDHNHSCGGSWILNVYYWPGITTWHTPGNAGQYKYLLPGVVVPIATSVSINNKVLLLEKFGSGPPNSTGAYELDLTLVNNFSKAYREMHVQTDLFCGSNLVLPDKAARQITLGGYNGVALSGVRLYTPDGGPGVNGTNDWQENYQTLHLQRPRWYPTSAILANGSILTIGGQDTAQNIPQANLEVLPKPVGGDTVVNLPWLNIPNALYPFVTILPSKRIFVGYYNKASILDPATFATVTALPNIPGAVDDPTAGRNYPMSGAFLPLPQSAPYTAPLKVLICGGTTSSDKALDNCVSIEPEAANPTWTIERMPSKRVLPCMVPLPDGTLLIVNGARQGHAGFGSATDPNLNAVLYDPTLPVNARFSILGSTSIARMYHSEATLLPDGRVLISGSDPQDQNFPEEYRIEVFTPPYLNQGLTQPTFGIPIKDWAYSGMYAITSVQLFQGTTSTLRISLVAAPSSTHGNAMGARTLFPEFSCVGNTCTIVAPPNSGVCPPGWYQLFILDGPTPSVSQWVHIGGDPSQLGNWPNLPGFTQPGV